MIDSLQSIINIIDVSFGNNALEYLSCGIILLEKQYLCFFDRASAVGFLYLRPREPEDIIHFLVFSPLNRALRYCSPAKNVLLIILLLKTTPDYWRASASLSFPHWHYFILLQRPCTLYTQLR